MDQYLIHMYYTHMGTALPAHCIHVSIIKFYKANNIVAEIIVKTINNRTNKVCSIKRQWKIFT